MCQLSQWSEVGFAQSTLALVSYSIVSQQAKENALALDSFLPAEAFGFSKLRECCDVYPEGAEGRSGHSLVIDNTWS